MCSMKDLTILVVETDIDELKKICVPLREFGVQTIICVTEYKEAMDIIDNDKEIDLIISNIDLGDFRPSGIFLCEMAKRKRPEVLFIVNLKNSGIIFIGQSLSAGADGLLRTNCIQEIESILPKWLNLAVKRRDVDEIINK